MVWILRSGKPVQVLEAANIVSAPLRPLRIGDIVEVLKTGQRRRVSEINEGTPTLYRACVQDRTAPTVRDHDNVHLLVDHCEWYLADELSLVG